MPRMRSTRRRPLARRGARRPTRWTRVRHCSQGCMLRNSARLRLAPAPRVVRAEWERLMAGSMCADFWLFLQHVSTSRTWLPQMLGVAVARVSGSSAARVVDSGTPAAPCTSLPPPTAPCPTVQPPPGVAFFLQPADGRAPTSCTGSLAWRAATAPAAATAAAAGVSSSRRCASSSGRRSP